MSGGQNTDGMMDIYLIKTENNENRAAYCYCKGEK